MPHTIRRAQETSRSFRNVPTYDEAGEESFRCRITGKALSIRHRMTEEDTVIFDIYVYPFPILAAGGFDYDTPTEVFRTTDRITLPDDQAFIDTTPLIFAVGRETDELGHHHVKLQCGWMYHRQTA